MYWLVNFTSAVFIKKHMPFTSSLYATIFVSYTRHGMTWSKAGTNHVLNGINFFVCEYNLQPKIAKEGLSGHIDAKNTISTDDASESM